MRGDVLDNHVGHWCDVAQPNQRENRPSLNSHVVRKLIPYSLIPLPFEFLFFATKNISN